MDTDDPSVLYRFRSIESLLDGYHELENQEIYLASREELNDPMEGYKDVTWLGDRILWQNLLGHYVLSLMWTFTEYLLISDKPVEKIVLRVHITIEDLPTDAYRSIAREAIDLFLSVTCVQEALDQLSSLESPLSRDGLLFYLSNIHVFAWRSVHDTLAKHRMCGPSNVEIDWETLETSSLSAMKESGAIVLKPSDSMKSEHLEMYFTSSGRILDQLGIILNYNSRNSGHPKRTFLLARFPDLYLTELVRTLVHPPWYTACFSRNCTNASMWGTYGIRHTGVALKFQVRDTDTGSPSIALRGVVGVGGSRTDPTPKFIPGTFRGKFERVSYSARAPTVSFFHSIGNLPLRKRNAAWLCDGNGQMSAQAVEAIGPSDEWRERQWNDLRASATTKLADWQHEDEYRLLVPDYLGMLADHRKVQYDFSSLVGIVFGLATSMQDKLRIMEMVEQKCRLENRETFEFLQARYSSRRGRIDAVPMKLLRYAIDQGPRT